MEVYLDNNSTTPMDPKIQEIYCESTKIFGNANVIYKQGIECRAALNGAYDKIYDSLNASDDDDIIFTSSTTEGNNAVIKTFLDAYLRDKENGKNHIISTVAEHASIKSPLAYCKSFGMEVTYLGTDENGLISLEELKEAITDKTALVTVLYASNETGAIQPIKEIARMCQAAGIPVHTDAAQAIGKIKVDLQDLGVNYFTWSAHKFHGPKGIGGLYVKAKSPYVTHIHGSKNVMGGKRAGSVYNNGAIAMGEAIEMANSDMSIGYIANHTKKLRDKLEAAILELEDTKSYVPKDHRLNNIVVASFRGIEGEAMLWDMNEAGIYISTGSSCSSEDLEASAVVEALGEKVEIANATVMFALSKFTTEAEIDYVIQELQRIVPRIREISMTYAKQEAFSAFIEDHH
ncbi:MAG: aminotransferase class V-fold PLP-dependent enzyme [Campylobacterales bacterium]|nr:aminotransferase class V-fold PLP-dependent enzyme [Campylobacterales bacterium]